MTVKFLQQGLYRGLFVVFSLMVIQGCADKALIRQSALQYFKEGNAAFDVRDYNAAIWHYVRAINLDSTTPEFYYNLGLVYYEIGNYKESLDAFENVLLMIPELPDTHYNMALAYNKLYNSDKANEHYNQYQAMLSVRMAQEAAARQKESQTQDAQNPNQDSGSQVSAASSGTTGESKPSEKKSPKKPRNLDNKTTPPKKKV
ncbi:MAG: tetratricopeptide repeat protein [SAR324 cluster bacterium]|nr:tetratricopeptide repeat protein [SAR324 cluster bacterium]MBF0349774.1 tetratricopeptide repeat protein [SAR324 cluster bacterium]